MIGSRLAEVGSIGREGLISGINRSADVVAVRPSVWLGQSPGLLGRFPALSSGMERTAAALGPFKAPLSRLSDFFSLIWRPQSALTESAQTLEVLATGVGAHVVAVEKTLPLLRDINRAFDAWSAGQHLTYLSTHGQLQTVPPPRRLRPHEFLKFVP